jgi:DNA-binding transcriptional LysR family regulator
MAAFRTFDLNLLRVFDAVMIERNVTQAAASLCMTQPAVSNAINRLRHSLQDPLFLKVHGGVAPTPRAQALWPPLKDALRSIEETVDTHEFDPARGHAVFSVAASDYVLEHLIQPTLHRLLRTAPRVELHVKPHRIKDAVGLLERGEIDFAAGVLSNFNEHIRAQPLATLEYSLAMRKGHVLAQAPFGEADFLAARHAVVSLSGGPAMIDVELAERGLRRNIAVVLNHYAMVPSLLAQSDLVCIVPTRVVEHSHLAEQLHWMAPPLTIQPRTVSLIWHERSDHSSEHRWMREELLRRAGD